MGETHSWTLAAAVGKKAEAARRTSSGEHVLVVYGKDGMDEVSLGAATMVGELKDGEVLSEILVPAAGDAKAGYEKWAIRKRFDYATISAAAARADGRRRDVHVAERHLGCDRREEEDDDVRDDVHVGDEVDLAAALLLAACGPAPQPPGTPPAPPPTAANALPVVRFAGQGLAADELYRDETTALRDADSRVCEFVRLSVDMNSAPKRAACSR